MATDMDVIIIGAGMSGIGMAIQLIRNFGTRSFEIIEKTSDIGGTWFLNSYPGCGCDVPSHFYSYSFALNPNWSRKFALQPEIRNYFASVASQYDIRPHVQFRSAVVSADYESDTATWRVVIENQETGFRTTKRCRILISAVGSLSVPKGCDIPGAETYKGRLFHSAKWDHSFDYKDKEVVCIGNGCSATQFVPVISDGPNKVKKVTQFSRQAHWLSERPNPEYSQAFRFLMRWVPGAMRIYRGYLFGMAEKDFAGFPNESGKALREEWKDIATRYIEKNSPDKYRDFLVPNTVIGCKRRVMDTDYLACLHRKNVELVYEDPIARITQTGVETKSGRVIDADAIVLANGFETQKPLFPMTIRGQNGQDVSEHWMEFGRGSPEAYFGTCFSGFPNFFVLFGPNTLSGHLSVIYTAECQINFILRVVEPIMSGLNRSMLSNLIGYEYPDSVAVTSVAERRDVETVDQKAKGLVYASGCSSWFIDEKTGRNTSMYPDWQFKFWLRSIFVRWTDFTYKKPGGKSQSEFQSSNRLGGICTAVALIALGAAFGSRGIQYLEYSDKLSTIFG